MIFFPLDAADVFRQGEVDVLAFGDVHLYHAGDFLGLPVNHAGYEPLNRRGHMAIGSASSP